MISLAGLSPTVITTALTQMLLSLPSFYKDIKGGKVK
jgi:hypothetical protein